ncbi:hypothetical protein [Rhodococcus triatomae]|nr:hypothetical protein G419_16353 [Rhodococcus triatomae BKS 15-14]
MNATATIARLRALIDHPRTGAEERDAAQRMLGRLLARTASPGRGSDTWRDGLGRHVRIDGIVDAIRTDIAVARTLQPPSDGPEVLVHDAVRGAPEDVVFDVVADGDAAIVVTIDAVPPAWGWVDDAGVPDVSPELQGLADRIAELVNGYNHHGPDGTPRFFGRVRVPGRTLVW